MDAGGDSLVSKSRTAEVGNCYFMYVYVRTYVCGCTYVCLYVCTYARAIMVDYFVISFIRAIKMVVYFFISPICEIMVDRSSVYLYYF